MYKKSFLVYVFLIVAFWPLGVISKEVINGPVTAEVVKVIDGDTLDVLARIWLHQAIQTRVRISNIDTPELRGKCEFEITQAKQAKKLLTEWVDKRTVTLRNIQFGKYAGRVLADVETPDGFDVSQQLIKAGLARPYKGKKRTSWCN